MDNVLPHSPLKQLSTDLWIIEGSLPHKNPLPRNMLIFRTPEGKLWVHSPVAVSEQTLDEIKSLGIPEWIVVPNSMHRLDALTWKKTFPEALLLSPRKAKKEVEKKVPVDAICEETFLKPPMVALPMAGTEHDELAYELSLKAGKALVINDVIVNIESLPGILGKLIALMGRIGRFRVPKPQVLIFLHQKRLFKRWLLQMAKRNFTIVTVSHGDSITSDVPRWLRSAAHELIH